MAAQAFSLGLHFISDHDVTSPPPAKTHTRKPSDDEIDAIELPDYGLTSTSRSGAKTGPVRSASVADGGKSAFVHDEGPKTPSELEGSEPSTPVHGRAAGVVPSFWYPKMNKFRVLAACLTYLGNGLNDSVPGALIPYMETWYHIGYAVVSMIFVANAVGFILSAFFTDAIAGKLGRAKALMTAEVIIIAGYVVIACTPPFAVVVVAYLLLGFGVALNLALNNVFCANLANPSAVLGAAHGSYGVGGVIAPIMATAMVTNGIHWSRFFVIGIGIRILCFAAVGWAYWSYESEGTTQFANSLSQIASQQAASEQTEPTKMRLIKRALSNRTTLLGALFIFAYQGAEVSESGWFISYLIDFRHADPAKVGYVTSGFWGGITLGRFVLTHLAPYIGEKRFVFILGAATIGFQLLAWLIPNYIGNSIAVAIVGLMLGPVYPCAQTIFSRLLPANIQVTAIGLISGGGSSGGAVVPFLTGLIAQSAGTWVLHPICIAFYAVMLTGWAFLPRIRKRTE